MFPSASRHYPGSYDELVAWFPDDDACRDYLDWLRWRDGTERTNELIGHASPAPGSRRHRRAFWVVASVFLALMAFSTVPSPLYGLYRARDHFSLFTVTVIYAVYAVAALARCCSRVICATGMGAGVCSSHRLASRSSARSCSSLRRAWELARGATDRRRVPVGIVLSAATAP